MLEVIKKSSWITLEGRVDDIVDVVFTHNRDAAALAHPGRSRTVAPLLLKRPEDGGSCDISVMMQSGRYYLHRLHIISTARICEIYTQRDHQGAADYACSVRGEHFMITKENKEDVQEPLSNELAEDTEHFQSEGQPECSRELEVKTADTDMHPQTLYKMDINLDDSHPCTVVKVKFLSLSDKSFALVKELLIYGTGIPVPVPDERTLHNEINANGGSSLLTIFVPSMLQMLRGLPNMRSNAIRTPDGKRKPDLLINDTPSSFLETMSETAVGSQDVSADPAVEHISAHQDVDSENSARFKRVPTCELVKDKFVPSNIALCSSDQHDMGKAMGNPNSPPGPYNSHTTVLVEGKVEFPNTVSCPDAILETSNQLHVPCDSHPALESEVGFPVQVRSDFCKDMINCVKNVETICCRMESYMQKVFNTFDERLKTLEAQAHTSASCLQTVGSSSYSHTSQNSGFATSVPCESGDLVGSLDPIIYSSSLVEESQSFPHPLQDSEKEFPAEMVDCPSQMEQVLAVCSSEMPPSADMYSSYKKCSHVRASFKTVACQTEICWESIRNSEPSNSAVASTDSVERNLATELSPGSLELIEWNLLVDQNSQEMAISEIPSLLDMDDIAVPPFITNVFASDLSTGSSAYSPTDYSLAVSLLPSESDTNGGLIKAEELNNLGSLEAQLCNEPSQL